MRNATLQLKPELEISDEVLRRAATGRRFVCAIAIACG
jgi:hypothetical protein